MANKKIEVDVIIQSEDSQQKLRELTKALKQLPTGTEDWKKVYGEIDDLKDRLAGAKKGTDDWIDRLEGAGGPLGMFGSGLNKAKVAFTSLDTAFKATGIGLLVSLVAGLVAAFTQSEGAMKKLQPLMIGLEKILGGIFRAFEPVLDAFIEMATTALPYITKGIGIFYSVLYGLFAFIKNVGVGVGKILKGIFTLDWDSVTEGYDALKNSISDSVDAAKASFGRYEAGTKELTKTEKENLAARQKNNEEAAKKAEELRKQQLEALKADLDAKIKLETDKENTSKEALKKLLDERYKAEISDKKLSDAQKLVLQEEYNKKLEEAIKADDERKKKKRIAELDALAQLEIDKANTSAQELKFLLDARLQEEINNVELSEAEKEAIRIKYRKQLEAALKEDRERQKKERLDALLVELDASKNNYDKQLEVYTKLQQELTNATDYSETERIDLRKKYSDAILQTLDTQYTNEKAAIEEKYGEFKRFDSEYYAAQRQAADQNQIDLKKAYDTGAINGQEYTKRLNELSKARKEIDKAEIKSSEEKVQLIGNALGQLSNIVGQDTVAGKAFAIAKATIDTYQSAVAAYKSLAGIPIIGPALGAIAAAAAVASGIATVKKIVAVQVPNAPQTGGAPVAQGKPSGPAERVAIPVNATPQSRAQGGLVRGPGGAFSDSIPALLSDGEFVINSRSSRLFQPLLQSINEAGNLPGFAAGGMVSKQQQNDNTTDRLVQAVQTALGQTPIRTYVSSTEISNTQQFDRVIKSRSLI